MGQDCRSHDCAALRPALAGKEVRLAGWVHSRRDHGGVYFFDLRDRSGFVQVVARPEAAEAFKAASSLGLEDVVTVAGTVQRRPQGSENPKIPTGDVELIASEIRVLNPSKPLPFEIDEHSTVGEETRLKYRFLDLRRRHMLENMTVRHRVAAAARRLLDAEGFLEVETPMLTKATPEGARDFLVPARLSPGTFYALPQSPQIFKQILMVSGLERYYQFARAFRDEDLRSDRQPEHTQIDIEMSFVEEADVHALVEKLIVAACRAAGVELQAPFPRLEHEEAMLRYGSDKPDIRFDFEISDLTPFFRETKLKVFREPLSNGGVVRGLKSGGSWSRSQLDELTALVKAQGAKGLGWLEWESGGASSPIEKFLGTPEKEGLRSSLKPQKGDWLFLVADQPVVAAGSLGALRKELIARLKPQPKAEFAPLWVLHFPLLEWEPEDKRWTFTHNPFTAPLESEEGKLDSDPGHVRSHQYDLVLNGVELASGSIRNHRAAMQRRIFKLMGFDDAEQERQFGLLLRALDFGAPPHGGIAIGYDRLIAILRGEDSIREVIAFPKTQKGVCPLSEAPSSVDPRQLKELHIQLALPRPIPAKQPLGS